MEESCPHNREAKLHFHIGQISRNKKATWNQVAFRLFILSFNYLAKAVARFSRITVTLT